MRILALDTSTLSGSVGLLEEERLVHQIDLDPALRTARSLAPALDAAIQAVDWQPSDVQLVAVTCGPGSFTGLRLGVTTAKTFAYAVRAEILGLNTLEIIAAQSSLPCSQLWAVMDAQRRELFAARFERGADGGWQLVEPVRILGREDWLRHLTPDSGVTGPGLLGLTEALPSRAVEAESQWRPRADTVGRVGWRHYRAGRRDDVWSLAPQYYRQSAAEEKRGAADRPPAAQGSVPST